MTACARCAAPNASKWCAKCRGPFYCSRECQVAAWPAHLEACKVRRRATRFADMVAVGPSLHQEHEYAHALAKAIGWSAVYDQVDAVDEDDPAGVLALQAAVLAVAEPLARGLHQHREAIRCVSSVALTMDIAPTHSLSFSLPLSHTHTHIKANADKQQT